MSYKKNMNLGLAGEYIVAGMISLEGIKNNEIWSASLTLKNYPGVDIFALNEKSNVHVGIQVKSTYKQSSILIGIKLKKDSSFEEVNNLIKCPYVFVIFDENFQPSFYIVSRKEMVKLAINTNDEYFQKAKEGVKPEQPIAIKVKNLQPFKNKWENIWIEE